jgi:23S rRNA pseudouridine1911/1915/1917 synthase
MKHHPEEDRNAADIHETRTSRQVRLHLRVQPKIRRVDNFLGQRYSAFSRAFFQKLIHAGKLTVNGRRVQPSYRVREGDVLEFELPVQPERIISPVAMDLQILYEDGDLFAINKPPGIMCHPGKKDRDDTLASGFIHHMHGPEKGKFNPGIVHRLDFDTTGVMVVAKNPFAHVYLSRQFETRMVHKEYLALVRGRLPRHFGQIDTPIGYSPKRWGLMSAGPEAARPRPALSLYEVRERFRGHTLVSVVLKTGRTHQVRVHFESIGHPVIGERYYRGGLGPDPLEELMPRLALHAWKLRITHPTTREPMDFTAELPPDFAAALGHLRSLEQQATASGTSPPSQVAPPKGDA